MLAASGGGGGSAVEVDEDSAKPWLGRFLRASRAVPAGGLLLRERYLSFAAVAPTASRGRAHLELYRAVAEGEVDQDAEGSPEEGSCRGRWGAGVAEIRAADLDVGDAAFAEGVARELAEALLEDPSLGDDVVIEDVAYVARVFGKNSFSFEGEDGRSNEVIFRTISRASHSCAPNATIREGPSRSESLLIAVREMHLGDPVNIFYLADQCLLKSTASRRAAIQKEWRFLCRCDRCEAELDHTRAFCFECSCGARGFVFAPSSGGLLCCGGGGGGSSASSAAPGCGARLEDRQTESRALEAEGQAEELLAELEDPDDLALPSPDTLKGLSLQAAQLLFGFAKDHPLHRVSAEVSRRRVAALFAQGRLEEAAAAQRAFVGALAAMLPEGLRGVRWLAEVHGRLAYLSELSGARGQATAALELVLDHLQVVFNYRPVVQSLAGMFESEAWWKLLDDVAPELNRLC